MTPPDVMPCLIQDVHQLLLHHPGLAFRQPTSHLWGLSPYLIGSTVWYAISVSGCAKIAVRRRPWIYQRATPDLGELAAALALRFKHAEPKDGVGRYLFQLDEALGPSGAGCLLAHATSDNFPWIHASTAKPIVHAESLSIDPTEWRQLCEMSMEDTASLVSGGALPASVDAAPVLIPCLARLVPDELMTDAGQASARQLMIEALRRERGRLTVLACLWPVVKINPYHIPDWLTATAAEVLVDDFLTAHIATLRQAARQQPSARTHGASTIADAPQRARRPTVVPGLQVPRSLSESDSDDFLGTAN